MMAKHAEAIKYKLLRPQSRSTHAHLIYARPDCSCAVLVQMAFSQPPPGYPMAMGPSSGHVRVNYKRAPNFLERVGGSICGSCVGVGLIIASCFLLFLNEVCM